MRRYADTSSMVQGGSAAVVGAVIGFLLSSGDGEVDADLSGLAGGAGLHGVAVVGAEDGSDEVDAIGENRLGEGDRADDADLKRWCRSRGAGHSGVPFVV